MKPWMWILIAGLALAIVLVIVFVVKGQDENSGGGGNGGGGNGGGGNGYNPPKKGWCFKDTDKAAKQKCLAEGGSVEKFAISKCGAFKNYCFYV